MYPTAVASSATTSSTGATATPTETATVAASSEATPIASVTSIDALQLETLYDGITLRIEDRGREPFRWENVVGAFHWKTDLPSNITDTTGREETCEGPVFVRTFPSGQVVTVGMHTPSRVIRFALGSSADGSPVFMHPRILRGLSRG